MRQILLVFGEDHLDPLPCTDRHGLLPALAGEEAVEMDDGYAGGDEDGGGVSGSDELSEYGHSTVVNMKLSVSMLALTPNIDGAGGEGLHSQLAHSSSDDGYLGDCDRLLPRSRDHEPNTGVEVILPEPAVALLGKDETAPTLRDLGLQYPDFRSTQPAGRAVAHCGVQRNVFRFAEAKYGA